MPEVLCETCEPCGHTPEHQTDCKEHLPAAKVGQEPSEDPSNGVEVVEDGAGQDLVDQSTATVPPPTGCGVWEVWQGGVV